MKMTLLLVAADLTRPAKQPYAKERYRGRGKGTTVERTKRDEAPKGFMLYEGCLTYYMVAL